MQNLESKLQIERPKEGFAMRSLRALRIVGIGLAFAVILASGGLSVGSQSGQEVPPSFIVTVSYPDDAIAFVDLLPDGRSTVTRVSVAGGPIGLAVHPNRLFTYVVSWDANVLSVVDNQTRRVVRAVSLGLGVNPYSVAVRPDGRVAYVVNAGTKEVAVLDTSDASNPQLLTRIALPGSQAPRNLAFTPSGRWALVSDSESGRVQVIDTPRHQRVGALETGGRCAIGVRVSHFGRWLYVADRCTSSVYAIEAERLGTTAPKITPIPLQPAAGAWYIAFSPDDRFAYVSLTEPRRDTSSGQIAIIDTEQKSQIGAIPVGGFPAGLDMLVKTPNPDDPETWQYVLVIFNPGASVQQQPIGSDTGQPTGPPTTTRTGLSKNTSGQPSGDGQSTRGPTNCRYKITETKGTVKRRLPGEKKWQRLNVNAGDVIEIPEGTRITTGYKSFARMEIWCENPETKQSELMVTVLLFPISDIKATKMLVEKGQLTIDQELHFGMIDLDVKEVQADIKVESGFSTTGIRGTSLKVGHDPERKIDLHAVAKGKIEVESTVGAFKGQKVVLTGPGDCKTVQRVTVNAQGEISPIETVPFVPEEWPLLEKECG